MASQHPHPRGLESLIECMARDTICAQPADVPKHLAQYGSDLIKKGGKTNPIEKVFRYQETRDLKYFARNKQAPLIRGKVPLTPVVAEKTQKTTSQKSAPKVPADVPTTSRNKVPIGTRGKPENASIVLPQKKKECSVPRPEKPKEETKPSPKTRPPLLIPAQSQRKGTIENVKKTPDPWTQKTTPRKAPPKVPANVSVPPKPRKPLPTGTGGKPENTSNRSLQKPRESSVPRPERPKAKEESKPSPKIRPPLLTPAKSQKKGKGATEDVKKTLETRPPIIPQSAPKVPAVNPPSRRPTLRQQAATGTSLLPPFPQKKAIGSQQQKTMTKKSVPIAQVKPEWNDCTTLPGNSMRRMRTPAIATKITPNQQCPRCPHLVQVIQIVSVRRRILLSSPQV
ncbi:uncharacterized protein LOC134126957 [Pungitius pungitius]|uniref:uncharacterized protein LOC134126957 n=1 Tax=Pungitius pungitius TaxID=134920 RepID=UPI002E16222C